MGNFYRHLVIFSGHTGPMQTPYAGMQDIVYL